MHNILRKKTHVGEKSEMKRNLGLWDVIFLGIGAMVGTGIFTITGIGAATIAGPALIISILIAALAVGISAMFYAEFASRIPVQGSVYGYLYEIGGEFVAWIAGWLIIMEFMTAISSVAAGWGGYVKGLIDLHLPEVLSGPPGTYDHFSLDLMPMLVIVLVALLVLMNAKTALRFNSILVALKLVALFLFVVVGLFYIKPANWSDFAPFGWGNITGTSSTGIMAGAATMFFAFLGFESIALAVDEVKEPQKNIPKGIIGSLSLTAVLYIVITLVLTGMVNYTKLNVNDAVAFALRQVGAGWAAAFVSTVAIFTLITVCVSMMYALARMIYGISKDGLLPEFFGTVSKNHKVPTHATYFAAVLSMIFAGLFPLDKLANFLSICTLAYLIMLAIGILKLRKDRGLPTGDQFKTPLVPVLPILSILICLSFMLQYDAYIWGAFAIALVIAVIIYFAYGYHNSELHDKKVNK
jgi:APA family basic amino acid/polyamine antiporter